MALQATRPIRSGDEEQAADCRKRREDRLRQPLVGDERIAERGVCEQLACRDLVVGDDPVAEADVPPHVGIAQRIEPDGACEDQDRGEQRPAWVREPRDEAVPARGSPQTPAGGGEA